MSAVYPAGLVDVVAVRTLGDWTIRLTRRPTQHAALGPRGQIIRGTLWQIVAVHPQRGPMTFVYEGEVEARGAFDGGTEAQLFEAACIGRVLS